VAAQDITFVDAVPGSARKPQGTKDGSELTGEQTKIREALHDNPHKWAKLGDQVRSPERFFPLRNHQIELAVRPNGVAPGIRDNQAQVQVYDVYGRHVPGYVHQPRSNKNKAAPPPPDAAAPREQARRHGAQ
jgi:hypothetical protein